VGGEKSQKEPGGGAGIAAVERRAGGLEAAAAPDPDRAVGSHVADLDPETPEDAGGGAGIEGAQRVVDHGDAVRQAGQEEGTVSNAFVPRYDND
jgi:hypothetical protein